MSRIVTIKPNRCPRAQSLRQAQQALLPPTPAISSKASAPLLAGCVCLFYLSRAGIALVNDAHAVESQHFIDKPDVSRAGSDQSRKAAGGYDLRLVAAKLFDDALDDSIGQPDITVKESRLNVSDGVRADHSRRTAYIDLRQTRSTHKERLCRNSHSGSDRSTEILAAFRDHVESSRRTEIHDNARPAISFKSGHTIHNAIRADFGRIIDQHWHSRFDSRLDEQRLCLKIALANFAQRRIERRHDRRDHNRFHLGRIDFLHREEIPKQHPVFVGRAGANRSHAPVRHHVVESRRRSRVLVSRPVQTKNGIRISYIDDEKHCESLLELLCSLADLR